MAELATIDPSVEGEGQSDSLVDVNVQAKAAYDRGYHDINFFAALALPTVFEFALPAFYIAMWQILAKRDKVDIGRILRFALGLPRGHAKTTFIKVLICWLLVYDKATFVLIVCANEQLAEQLLADISDMLGSPNMEAVYGNWTSCLSTDTKELKKAQYHLRPVVLAAKGAGSSLRGLNIKHHRPDLIFCDDMQTRENDESPTESLRLLRWFTATLLKVIAPRGDRLVIYVGNMYSDECILKKLQNNSKWTSLVTGAILENGQPLWPELHSLEALMESYLHDEELGQADIWFAEVMNDPKSASKSLLPNKLPDYPYEEGIIPDGAFLTIDPAGFKDNSDDNVIAVHHVFDGRGIIAETAQSSTEPALNDPEQLILVALKLAVKHGASLIAIEDVGYQSTLQFWVTKYINQLGLTGIHVVPLNPHGRSKEARIRLFIQELYAQNYYLHHSVRPLFVWQATKYKLGAKKNKDDYLDACSYGLDVRNDPELAMLVINLLHKQQHAVLAHVVGDNTPF
jgi:hypothetical protein